MRATRVGDAVEVRPMARARLAGVIVGIDGMGLRRVATPEGDHYAAPDDLYPCATTVATKATPDLIAGDHVVLMTGEVGRVRAVGQVVEVAGPRSVWRLSLSPSRLWVLAPGQ